LTNKPIWTERNINPLDACNGTSKKGSEYTPNIFTDDNSTFRGATNRSKKNPFFQDDKRDIKNEKFKSPSLEDYWDKISKMMHLMTDADDRGSNNSSEDKSESSDFFK